VKQEYQRNQRNRGLEGSTMEGIHIRDAALDDAAAIAEIYNQGVEDRIATFETELRSPPRT
jgi:hypothetical protein